MSIDLSFSDSSSNFVQMWMRICKPNNDGRIRMYEEIVVMPISEPDIILFSIIIKSCCRLAMSEMETKSDVDLGADRIPV